MLNNFVAGLSLATLYSERFSIFAWAAAAEAAAAVNWLNASSTPDAHSKGLEMKVEMSEIKGAGICLSYWFRGEKRQQHIITSHGPRFHTLAFTWLPAHLEIALSPRVHAPICRSQLVLRCSWWCNATHCQRQFETRRKGRAEPRGGEKEMNQTLSRLTWVTLLWASANGGGFFKSSCVLSVRHAGTFF